MWCPQINQFMIYALAPRWPIDYDRKDAIVNSQGFIILLVAFVGLIPICRNKRWNWNIVRSSLPLTILFWAGWFGSLAVGALVLLRVVG